MRISYFVFFGRFDDFVLGEANSDDEDDMDDDDLEDADDDDDDDDEPGPTGKLGVNSVNQLYLQQLLILSCHEASLA